MSRNSHLDPAWPSGLRIDETMYPSIMSQRKDKHMTIRQLSWVLLTILPILIVTGCAPRQPRRGEIPSTRPAAKESADSMALMRRGEELFTQERFHEAARIYAHILKDYPQSPVDQEARYRLALCYYHLDQPKKTIKVLRQLGAFDLPSPRRVKLYTLMAESYLKLENPLEVLTWFFTALESTDDEETKTELQGRLRQVVSENLTNSELREVAFIFRGTYLGGYARFVLAQRLLEEGDVDRSRELLAEVLRFHGHEDFYPEVETFLEAVEEFVPDEFVLGCILPLSGRGASSFGEPSLNGIELAIHAFEPGYERLNLRLVVKDSKSSPQRAERAVEELVHEEGVLAILGPLLRVTSEAAALKAEELNVPLIALTTKEDITQRSDFVFRNGLSYPLQMRSLVTYAMDYQEMRRFAVFYPDDGYGRTLSSLFIDEVYRLGGDIVVLESYVNSQMDFGAEIKRMVRIREEKTTGRGAQKRYKPIIDFDGIFIPDQADRVALIAPQFAYYDVYGITFLGTNSWNNPHLIEKAGKFIQGAFLVDEFYRGSQAPLISDFVARFRRVFDDDPTIFAAQAYDVAAMIVALLEDHPVLSREAMREELANLEGFAGVSGFYGFDPTGNARKTPLVLTVEGNRFREVSLDFTKRLDYQ
jgi:ABC-type branched-subunit amino acid transport system substrate-binding protein